MAGTARTGAQIQIVPMLPEHWPEVERIYAQGLATGHASFQTATPTRTEFDAAHLAEPRLAACRDGEVLGWAVVSQVSARTVYAGVVECSVYVAEAARGAGVGRALLVALTGAADVAGIWTIQAGIFPENAASLALHHRCGFRTVGVRERLGRHQGVWRDVVLLERRSPSAG